MSGQAAARLGVLFQLLRTAKLNIKLNVWTHVWTIALLLIALLLTVPILVVLSSVFTETGAVWSHLLATVLPRYFIQSLLLLLGVGAGTALLGVSTAWLVTMCRFPGSRILEWALLLPMAAPAYLLAYTYTELLDYYGLVQSLLRSFMGWNSATDYWFPPIRSLGGAIILLSLVLYPYVYLIVRTAFLEQSVCTLEASRLLGCNPWRSFWRVALPLARPALGAGLALVLMETLNDFGTVQYFSVETLTVGIYRTWFGMGDRMAASQLSALLVGAVVVLLLLEQGARRQARYGHSGRAQSLSPYLLAGWRSRLAIAVCLLPVLLGFGLPAIVLLHLALTRITANFTAEFWQLAANSFMLASGTAALAAALALLLTYSARIQPGWLSQLALRCASMGYAIPGAVIAVGVLLPVGRLDNLIDATLRATAGFSTGLLLSGTIATLIFAYLVRFLAIACGSVESSLTRIKPNLDEAARSLGCSPAQTLQRVHVPLLRGGLLTAALLVFVDVMKELPATLIIRPFNFDTLAVQVYQLAADERLAEAAAPALAIGAVGLIPVVLLSRQIARSSASRQGTYDRTSSSSSDTHSSQADYSSQAND